MRLSLNTVTVKERWGLAECIEGCARHGIPGISPWRDVRRRWASSAPRSRSATPG
jgi:hypothetical protein